MDLQPKQLIKRQAAASKHYFSGVNRSVYLPESRSPVPQFQTLPCSIIKWISQFACPTQRLFYKSHNIRAGNRGFLRRRVNRDKTQLRQFRRGIYNWIDHLYAIAMNGQLAKDPYMTTLPKLPCSPGLIEKHHLQGSAAVACNDVYHCTSIT